MSLFLPFFLSFLPELLNYSVITSTIYFQWIQDEERKNMQIWQMLTISEHLHLLYYSQFFRRFDIFKDIN